MSNVLDIGAAVNSAASWVGQSPILNSAFGNPFIASLIVTALVAIVIMATFHYKVTSDNFKQTMKVGFYTYCATLLVLYLHHHIVSQNLQESGEAARVRQFFGGLDLANSNAHTTGGYEKFNVQSVLGGSMHANSDTVADRAVSDRAALEVDPAANALPNMRPNNVLVQDVPVNGRPFVTPQFVTSP
jgi:hypothetical protein